MQRSLVLVFILLNFINSFAAYSGTQLTANDREEIKKQAMLLQIEVSLFLPSQHLLADPILMEGLDPKKVGASASFGQKLSVGGASKKRLSTHATKKATIGGAGKWYLNLEKFKKRFEKARKGHSAELRHQKKTAEIVHRLIEDGKLEYLKPLFNGRVMGDLMEKRDLITAVLFEIKRKVASPGNKKIREPA